MKRILLLLGCLAMLAVTAQADGAGSAFGAMATAQSSGQGKGYFGVGLGLADATSFFGSFTYGLSQWTDGRIKIGLIDPDVGDTKITFGADFKWQFWNVSPQTNHPFDFAIGGLFEFASLERVSILQAGGHLTGSYPISLKGGGTLSPYGRFNTRLESIDVKSNGVINPDAETNLEVGFNAGVQWRFTNTIAMFGEIQLDGNDGFFFGIDFNTL